MRGNAAAVRRPGRAFRRNREPGVRCVIHGHAHRGAHRGKTLRGAPVQGVPACNRARPVLNCDLGVEFALIEV